MLFPFSHLSLRITYFHFLSPCLLWHFMWWVLTGCCCYCCWCCFSSFCQVEWAFSSMFIALSEIINIFETIDFYLLFGVWYIPKYFRRPARRLQPSFWSGIWAFQGLISRRPHSSSLMGLWVGFMCAQDVIQRTPMVPWHVSPNGTAQYMEVRFCNSEHLREQGRGSKKKERFLKLCPRSDFPTSSTFSLLEGSHYVCLMLNGWELHKDMKTRS